MFRIRTLTDASAPANQKAIAEIQTIIRDQFADMTDKDVAKLPDQIFDPITHQFVAKVSVAEDGRGRIRGFSLLLVDPQLNFGYLELIATAASARLFMSKSSSARGKRACAVFISNACPMIRS